MPLVMIICDSMPLHVLYVLVYRLMSKMSWRDPKIYIVMIRVETFGYDSPRTTLNIVPEDAKTALIDEPNDSW